MDEKKYLELLDKAYSKLPENLIKNKRFVIPKVSGKIIRNRTSITNFKEISNIFSRDLNHLFRYFSKEAAVRSEIEKNGNVILYSKFHPDALNKIIVSYYENFVECPSCKGPDTELKDSLLICKVCGTRTQLN